ncbi:3-dehydroquinate synthase [Sphingomonas sp.]|uniref:3-dehydroquinate synthase n=1 Tax=Sphingomonas sp. TaxID=28214 RepID=UPI003B007B4F
MTRIDVALGNHSYPVLIEAGLLGRAGSPLAPLANGRPLAIVADESVAAHLATLTASLDAAGVVWRAATVGAGEASKSWTTLERVCDQLLDWGVERRDVVVALGGGVVGDLVGFAAAVLKRGARFVQIPTTLLAQVDSSVGGKTGINTAAGKNLVGAFHQPELVLIDPAVLDTLPPRELAAGYAEVVKYGLIDDPDLFTWCERNGAGLLAGDTDARTAAIARSVANKARIVAADEFETNGTRALLNLGHTFGHALEAAAGFDGSLLHGEAVAAGCCLAFDFSAARGLCSAYEAESVRAHCRSVGLPDGLAASGVRAGAAELVDHMRHDKKASGGALPFLLARGIGRTYLDRSVDLADVAAFLATQR